MKCSILPGVFDILPDDPSEEWRNSYLWQFVEETIHDVATLYGFGEIRTPIFERTELFEKGTGKETDIEIESGPGERHAQRAAVMVVPRLAGILCPLISKACHFQAQGTPS